MHNFCKISFIAAIAILFASCHSDIPDLPDPADVGKYQYCGYIDKTGTLQCKSPYVISEADCKKIDGHKFYSDAACKDFLHF